MKKYEREEKIEATNNYCNAPPKVQIISGNFDYTSGVMIN